MKIKKESIMKAYFIDFEINKEEWTVYVQAKDLTQAKEALLKNQVKVTKIIGIYDIDKVPDNYRYIDSNGHLAPSVKELGEKQHCEAYKECAYYGNLYTSSDLSSLSYFCDQCSKLARLDGWTKYNKRSQ